MLPRPAIPPRPDAREADLRAPRDATFPRPATLRCGASTGTPLDATDPYERAAQTFPELSDGADLVFRGLDRGERPDVFFAGMMRIGPTGWPLSSTITKPGRC